MMGLDPSGLRLSLKITEKGTTVKEEKTRHENIVKNITSVLITNTYSEPMLQMKAENTQFRSSHEILF